MELRQKIGWVLGPCWLLLTLLLPSPEGLSEPGWKTVGAAGLMATWWITEALPIPVTALLPMALFPILGLGTIKEVTSPYADPIVFLFLSGFLIALAMQRWELHRRIALGLISALGTRPNRILAGFLLSSALISMWVSNTATALMMLPIAISVVTLAPEKFHREFGAALMLAVAYGSTAGGMATLIGTPPNALMAAYLNKVHGYQVGFGQWMLIGLPITLLTLPLVYWVLTRVVFQLKGEPIPGMVDLLREEQSKLGGFTRGEKWVTTIFLLTASGWILRPFISHAIPNVSDTTIGMLGALCLFMIPMDWKRGEFVMRWEDTKALPWDVLLLFGGGLSLAGVMEEQGVSQYLGEMCRGLEGFPILLTMAILCFGILMLTELTSNTGTAATFLPVVAAVAISLGQNPLLFLIPTALAANCSFMMPVGTPPNAIVFATGWVRLPQMAKAGLWLNCLMVPLVVAVVWLLGTYVFGIRLDELPEWVRTVQP